MWCQEHLIVTYLCQELHDSRPNPGQLTKRQSKHGVRRQSHDSCILFCKQPEWKFGDSGVMFGSCGGICEKNVAKLGKRRKMWLQRRNTWQWQLLQLFDMSLCHPQVGAKYALISLNHKRSIIETTAGSRPSAHTRFLMTLFQTKNMPSRKFNDMEYDMCPCD